MERSDLLLASAALLAVCALASYFYGVPSSSTMRPQGYFIYYYRDWSLPLILFSLSCLITSLAWKRRTR